MADVPSRTNNDMQRLCVSRGRTLQHVAPDHFTPPLLPSIDSSCKQSAYNCRNTKDLSYSCLKCYVTFLGGRQPCDDKGVLAQEILPQYKKFFGFEDEISSYIASSYVKFVESSGARVVPVMVNQDREYYRFIAESVNGILFPGGSLYFNGTDGYFGAGRVLYDIAVEMNDAGEYFPLLGICLGFELLAVLAADSVDHRTSCRSYNRALPLHFNHGFQESKMFSGRSLYHKEIVGILSLEHVTPDFHHYCITGANMTDVGIAKEWQIISFNKDSNGLVFVSTMEHMNYPFYGVQYHPEKNAFEWKVGKNHPHFQDAILTSQFFANFFVNEARKNSHRFPTTELERQHLIYRYDPKFTIDKTVFQQCYVF